MRIHRSSSPQIPPRSLAALLLFQPINIPPPKNVRIVLLAAMSGHDAKVLDDEVEPTPEVKGPGKTGQILETIKNSPSEEFCSADFASLNISVGVASQALIRLERRGLLTLVRTEKPKTSAVKLSARGRSTKWYRYQDLITAPLVESEGSCE